MRLRGLPRTPQHNSWAERSIKDLKDESQFGKGVLVRDHREPRERIALPAWEIGSGAVVSQTAAGRPALPCT